MSYSCINFKNKLLWLFKQGNICTPEFVSASCGSDAINLEAIDNAGPRPEMPTPWFTSSILQFTEYIHNSQFVSNRSLSQKLLTNIFVFSWIKNFKHSESIRITCFFNSSHYAVWTLACLKIVRKPCYRKQIKSSRELLNFKMYVCPLVKR